MSIYIVAATSPPHGVVPMMSASSAYDLDVTSIALQENSAYSAVSPLAAVAEYENIAGLQWTTWQ